MSIRVSVAGATGYSGAELCVLLARHPGVVLAGAFSSSSGGARMPFASLHPALRGVPGPEVLPFTAGALAAGKPGVVFLATPNETSAELVPQILATGAKVIDLSGAFRLKDAAAYPAWYGFTHPDPALLHEAVYAVPELMETGTGGAPLPPRAPHGTAPSGILGRYAGARLVANPGCYPTSVLLALVPLLPLLDPAQPIVCDSASGVSGAGKKSELAWSFAELAGNFKAYGVGTHRHEPEMREQLGLPAGATFVFVPHLLPTVRGILSTIHVGFAEPQTAEGIAARYAARYADAPLVDVLSAGKLPELKDVVGTPRAAIGFTLLAGGMRAVIVSAIDNLLKGAASQAVQNLNRLCGFAETEGLA